METSPRNSRKGGCSRALAAALSLGMLCLLLPAHGLAQQVPEPDGGTAPVQGDLPDASVGEGGADRENQEREDATGRVVSTCRSSSDCNARFGCDSGRCVYIGVRRAEGGCWGGQAATAGLAAAGLVAAAGLRRRRGG